MTVYEVQVYDIPSFCRAYSISRSFAYLEIKAGRLRPFKAGRKTLISREAAETWRLALEKPSPQTSHAAEAPTPRQPILMPQERNGDRER